MQRMHRLPRVAAALAAAGLALGACDTSTGGGEASSPAAATQTEIGAGEGQLSILTWPGYAEDGSHNPDLDWVTPFEEATGCQVSVTTFGTSDEAVTLMGSGQYDVVSASGDASLRLIAGGDVQPVNVDLLENYGDIYPYLRDRQWNTVDGVHYGMPHGWGANLLMYRTDLVDPAPASWSAVFDDAARYKGKVTAYDSPMYIADAALYLMKHRPELGITHPYALDRAQLAAAVDLLKAQRGNIGQYWSDYAIAVQAFSSGSTVLGASWQVIANVAKSQGADVEAILPSEGATGWSDTWMIGAGTDHPNCAYLWLDHIASPEVNAQVAESFGEAPANPKACELTQDPNHCQSYHAGDQAYADQVWFWTTPVTKCLDGRNGTECTDYSAWTQAWADIRG